MKQFFKENIIILLFIILLGLLFFLWGRFVIKEIKNNAYRDNLFTTEARINCILQYGWEVDPGGESEKTVVIPSPLDAVYIKYNKLQKPCGFDLTDYCGKTVICYTYPVIKFPYPAEDPVFVNILVYEGTLIGGDCMTFAYILSADRILW